MAPKGFSPRRPFMRWLLKLPEQITRLVCVEGWSSIAWWVGLRFDEVLGVYPPMSQAKRAQIESSVNRGRWGNPDLYRNGAIELSFRSACMCIQPITRGFVGRPIGDFLRTF